MSDVIRFGMIRMCEGLSMMLTPRTSLPVRLSDVNDAFDVDLFTEEFARIYWNEVRVTIYSTGSMLFYHFDDRETAERYASEILCALGYIHADGSVCNVLKAATEGQGC